MIHHRRFVTQHIVRVKHRQAITSGQVLWGRHHPSPPLSRLLHHRASVITGGPLYYCIQNVSHILCRQQSLQSVIHVVPICSDIWSHKSRGTFITRENCTERRKPVKEAILATRRGDLDQPRTKIRNISYLLETRTAFCGYLRNSRWIPVCKKTWCGVLGVRQNRRRGVVV